MPQTQLTAVRGHVGPKNLCVGPPALASLVNVGPTHHTAFWRVGPRTNQKILCVIYAIFSDLYVIPDGMKSTGPVGASLHIL
jgi:hypothetical protein